MLNWQKMVSFSVYSEELRDGSIATWSEKETIAWGPCTSPPILETFRKRISTSTLSSIEIASLLKKKRIGSVGNLWGNVVLDKVPFVILGVFSKHS